MSFLVVIPCLNEEKNIERLVLQLLDNNQNCEMRIVIADGGSADKTKEIAQSLAKRHKEVVYLYNPKRLQSSAINLAVDKFSGDAEFLIRIDAHANYPDDYCKKLIEEAKNTKADSVVVIMKTEGVNYFQKQIAAASNSKLGNGGSAHRSIGSKGRWIDHGHHALMRMLAFKEVGGYDENFSHNEDAELDVRLKKSGFNIWLTDKTYIVYHPRTSPLALFKQYINYGRGRVSNLLKHKSRPRLRQLLPVAVAPAFFLTFIAFLSQLWLLAVPFALWVMLCVVYSSLITTRSSELNVALVGFAAMIMHMSWSLGFWDGLVRNVASNKK